MRVNVYAEELTNRLEIVEKNGFTGLRLYLELPATRPACGGVEQVRGPFMHGPGDDDSSAVTFWGKQDLRQILVDGIALLDAHHAARGAARAVDAANR